MRIRYFYLLMIIALCYGIWTLAFKNDQGVTDTENYQVINSDVSTFKSYKMKRLSTFEGEFRVLSREDYHTGREAEISPTDLALGWGAMADPQVYKQLSIRQSNRWYYWHYENEPPIPRREIETHSANMHIIPANKAVAQKLSKVDDNDLIHLKGQLVEVSANDGWVWRSSLSREDTGNGACELFLVESIQIL